MRVLNIKTAVAAGIGGLCLSASLTWAQAEPGDSPFDQQPETRLACERLKSQIDQTIRDNGARHFLLEIVDNAQVENGVVREGESFAGAEVVGSCDGGTRKVVYSRQGATEMSAPDGDVPEVEGSGESLTPEADAPDADDMSERPAAGADAQGDSEAAAGQEPESSP